MIGTVLDQAQKLVGRSFLIAGFIPCAIAVAVWTTMVRGFGAFGALVNTWAQQPGKAAFQIGLTIVGVYLLGYVLYGVRGGINRLYQGSMPGVLGWLEWLLTRNQARRFRRCEKALGRLAAAVDTGYWPREFGFASTWVDRSLTGVPTDARAVELLNDAATRHDRLLRSLADDRPVRDEDYRRVLDDTRILQGLYAKPGAETPFAVQVNALVGAVAAGYRQEDALQAAVGRIRARALHDLTIARGEFAAGFPSDERLLRPTNLGNLMAALDYWVLERYAITLTDLWPRMLHVVADDVRARVDDANAYLDFTLMMSFLSVGTVGVGLAVASTGPPGSLPSTILLVAAPLGAAWVFYNLAMSATRAFGEHVRAAVDLFRLRLLDALGIEPPPTPAAEQPIWNELELFITEGVVPTDHVRFARPPPPAAPHPLADFPERLRRWLDPGREQAQR